MTPDQQFKRWIKWAMSAFVLVFAYFLLADLKMPLTPQAMATRVVTKMAPQVSGKVVEVAVGNNQHVKQGDLLFVLDPAPFELAVEQARLALAQAEQQNRQLDATRRTDVRAYIFHDPLHKNHRDRLCSPMGWPPTP